VLGTITFSAIAFCKEYLEIARRGQTNYALAANAAACRPGRRQTGNGSLKLAAHRLSR